MVASRVGRRPARRCREDGGAPAGQVGALGEVRRWGSTGAGARWCSHWWGAAKGSEDRRGRPSCPSEGARDARGEPQRALRRGHRWMVLRGCWGRAVNEAASADGCGRRKGLTRRSAALGRSRTRQIGSTTGSALLSSMNSTGGQAPPGRTMRSLSAGSSVRRSPRGPSSPTPRPAERPCSSSRTRAPSVSAPQTHARSASGRTPDPLAALRDRAPEPLRVPTRFHGHPCDPLPQPLTFPRCTRGSDTPVRPPTPTRPGATQALTFPDVSRESCSTRVMSEP